MHEKAEVRSLKVLEAPKNQRPTRPPTCLSFLPMPGVTRTSVSGARGASRVPACMDGGGPLAPEQTPAHSSACQCLHQQWLLSSMHPSRWRMPQEETHKTDFKAPALQAPSLTCFSLLPELPPGSRGCSMVGASSTGPRLVTLSLLPACSGDREGGVDVVLAL